MIEATGLALGALQAMSSRMGGESPMNVVPKVRSGCREQPWSISSQHALHGMPIMEPPPARHPSRRQPSERLPRR